MVADVVGVRIIVGDKTWIGSGLRRCFKKADLQNKTPLINIQLKVLRKLESDLVDLHT